MIMNTINLGSFMRERPQEQPIELRVQPNIITSLSNFISDSQKLLITFAFRAALMTISLRAIEHINEDSSLTDILFLSLISLIGNFTTHRNNNTLPIPLPHSRGGIQHLANLVINTASNPALHSCIIMPLCAYQIIQENEDQMKANPHPLLHTITLFTLLIFSYITALTSIYKTYKPETTTSGNRTSDHLNENTLPFVANETNTYRQLVQIHNLSQMLIHEQRLHHQTEYFLSLIHI